MTKAEKIQSLETSMTRGTRENGDEFYYFTDNAPKELVDLFLGHYEVREVDYETFSDACHIINDLLSSDEEIVDMDEEIYERANGTASVYTAAQLAYIDIWNQDEIAGYVRDNNFDIGTAAAYWYEQQVVDACNVIKGWVENN